MNSFELITKYLPEAIDEYFAHDSKTALLEKGNKFIDVSFNETGYVKIASILMDGLSDYYGTQQATVDRVNPGSARPSAGDAPNYAAYAGNIASGQRDGFMIGGMDITWEIFRLQWVRGKQFRIDYISNEETAKIAIGNALEQFNRVKVIPEVDATRFSFIASQTAVSLGNMVSLAVDAANAQTSGAYINTLDGPTGVIHRFNDAFEWMTEMGVPEEEQVIYVSPTLMTMIRNTKELVKFVTQGDYRSEAGIDFKIEKYAGRPIVEVPSDRFFTDILLTQNGYRAQSTSKVINFMVVSTKATVPVRKLEWNKIYGPEMSGLAGFHGYLIDYLLFHGMYVPRNKIPGVYVCVSGTNADTKVDLLRVHVVSAGSNNWKLKNFFTNPAGLRGTIVYSASSLGNIGASVTIDGSTVIGLGLDEVVTESSAAQAYYFGLVDASGVLIAKTPSTVTVN